MPSGVLTSEQDVPDEKLAKAEEQFRRMNTGVDNAGNVVFLDHGMKYIPMALPPDVAKLIETRQFGVAEVGRIYGIPPHMLGDLSRSTNNNIEQQAREYVMWCLAGRVEAHTREMQLKLLGRERLKQGHRLRTNIDALLRGDLAALSSWIDKLFKVGALSVNESRRLAGMNGVKDGDIHLVPMNMVELGMAAKQGTTGKAVAPSTTEDGVSK
jgi:HK97 family phage portal protein